MPTTHTAKRCPDGTIKVTSPTGTSILEQQAVAAIIGQTRLIPNPASLSRDFARMLVTRQASHVVPLTRR